MDAFSLAPEISYWYVPPAFWAKISLLPLWAGLLAGSFFFDQQGNPPHRAPHPAKLFREHTVSAHLR